MEKGPGSFIVLEGIDGAGISTQAARLQQALARRMSRKVLLTKQPSSGPVGALLRQVLSHRLQGIDDRTLALLFAADRQDHIRQEVKPVLAFDGIVICDRYLWSTLAYQGLSLEADWLKTINQHSLFPDITVFIKVRPEVSLARIVAGRTAIELFEREEILRKVAANFHTLVSSEHQEGHMVIEVDGEQPIDTVADQILTAVLAKLLGQADFSRKAQSRWSE